MTPSKYDPMSCVLKTCDRRKKERHDLCCGGHWRQVPRDLKAKFWAAQKIRSRHDRDFETMMAAGEILDLLEKSKVLLAPDVKLLTPESELEKPQDKTPRIIRP